MVKQGSTSEVSLFEKVPEDQRMHWTGIGAILSGVVSSLSKLMGGGLVAFYAGARLGTLALILTFFLSIILTYLVCKITYREGLPNNVTSRAYVFGTKGSIVGSIIWIFLFIGVLAVGTVQLGNAIIYYFHWSETGLVKYVLFILISLIWILFSLFGVKVIAKFNALFVAALFALLIYIVISMAMDSSLPNALMHGIMLPGVDSAKGFSVAFNTCAMTSGLLALFASDFTRFAKSEKDLLPISITGSFFGLATYFFGALLTYFGFEKSVRYFMSTGMDQASASHAAITNPGVTLVLAAGLFGLIVICLSQTKVETSNSIGGSNAVSNLVHAGFGVKLKWSTSVIITNCIGLIFIFGGILDKINMFMSFGSILTISWCTLMIVDYYIVRGILKIGKQGISSLEEIEDINWRGVSTIFITTITNAILYSADLILIPFILVVPMTAILYISFSIIWRKRVSTK